MGFLWGPLGVGNLQIDEGLAFGLIFGFNNGSLAGFEHAGWSRCQCVCKIKK
jgi:hypothetical protein